MKIIYHENYLYVFFVMVVVTFFLDFINLRVNFGNDSINPYAVHFPFVFLLFPMFKLLY